MASASGARNSAIWSAMVMNANEPRILGEMQTGYDAARGYLGDASNRFNSYADRGNQAYDMYANSLGMNGAGKAQEAQGAFESSTPYQGMLGRMQDALFRRKAAGGMLNSGNTDSDTMKLTRDYLSPYYQNWQNQLSGLGQTGFQATGQQAGNDQGMANLANNYYNARAGVMDKNMRDTIGMGVGALKAGDQAKTTNQNMLLGGINAGASLLGGWMGGGMPGLSTLTNAFGGGSQSPGGYTNLGSDWGSNMNQGYGSPWQTTRTGIF